LKLIEHVLQSSDARVTRSITRNSDDRIGIHSRSGSDSSCSRHEGNRLRWLGWDLFFELGRGLQTRIGSWGVEGLLL
jgi:hypothetical protein